MVVGRRGSGVLVLKIAAAVRRKVMWARRGLRAEFTGRLSLEDEGGSR